jgi:DNA helicase-2/ATP-dependent DNA helicase PcrA
MTTPEFEKAYKTLNLEQKRAVDIIDGPVMVVAGPGTGKTQILTLRIANILHKTDIEPEQILALTFTEAAVQNMRKRLANLIGSAAYSVVISTFHGFANDIIKNNPEDFPSIIGAESITAIDQISVVEKIIIDLDLPLLKPFGDTFFYVRSIVSALSELKREGVTPEKFSEIVEKEESDFQKIDDLYYDKGAHKGKMKGKYQALEKQIKKNKELAKVYTQYQQNLRNQKSYDFDDMIMETLRALQENPDLLLRLQEEHQYILVDEHQDTNNAQNKILELLANFHDEPNLFVVGDEKQSIFRFQGASLENFFYFKYLYPKAELITLEQNYRSTQTILDSAHSVLAGKTTLQSQSKEKQSQKIQCYALPDTAQELFFIATDIQQKMSEGISPEDIAVLYRNNADAFPLADIFQKMSIPFVVESDQDLFSEVVIKKFIKLLRAIHDFGNDEYLATVLHLDIFTFDPLDIFQVIRYSREKKKYGLFDVIKDEDMLKEAGVTQTAPFIELYTNMATWVKQSKNMNLTEFIEEVMRSSGLLNHILASDESIAGLDSLHSFMDEVRGIESGSAQAGLSEFFTYLDTVQQHQMFVKKKRTGKSIGHVRLMTAHRSKGLEFECVYITHARNGKWGNVRRPELLPLLPQVYQLISDKDKKEIIDFTPDKNDDERRLFYVALTRAKKSVTISYAQHADDGKEQLVSQFVDEMREDLIEYVSTKTIQEKYEKERGQLLAKVPQKQKTAISKELVREIFLKQGLSVSALNNYLRSPWQYFYRNLVRIPSSQNKSQIYGTVVHAALSDVFNGMNNGEEITKQALLDRFDEHLKRGQLSEKDFIDTQDKGHESLSVWFDAYEKTWQTRTLNEFRVNGVHLSEDIRLTGILDKVELITDFQVNVVDYKTGKPKTRNALMGNTKNDTGDYYRQLVFYKLLLNNFKDGRYHMISGEIDFIEPDDKGKLHKERFEIPDEDVAELEKTIHRVADEIMNLKFWDEPCDPEKCDYCELVEVMKRPL